MKQSLKILLAPYTNAETDINISGLANDSRAVKPGDLFIAYPGISIDRRHYISDAIDRGASAVLYEPDAASIIPQHASVPIIPLSNLAILQTQIAARFYQYPSKDMLIIAVTGTNGKTSVTQFIAMALTKLGIDCAVIGTNGMGRLHALEKNTHTTPDPIKVQQYLAKLKNDGVAACAIEASSHALAQHRLHGVDIDYAIFTNLTRDHLDYHQTMAAYGQAKAKLFTDFNLKAAIINMDDEFAKPLQQQCQANTVIEYGVHAAVATLGVTVKELKHDMQHTTVNLVTWQGEGEFVTQLLGEFNISNLLAVIALLLAMDVKLAKILQIIASLSAVDGRMQAIREADSPCVVVDYSHTPDALAKALTALAANCHGKLWCVFGCGGDRDKGKRPLMAKIAQKYSHKIIVTSDNPRHEQPLKIIEEIVAGFDTLEHVIIEPDRAAAIAKAVQSAKLGDIVLVAGKGHENYQIINNDVLPFSDMEHVKQQLSRRNKEKLQ